MLQFILHQSNKLAQLAHRHVFNLVSSIITVFLVLIEDVLGPFQLILQVYILLHFDLEQSLEVLNLLPMVVLHLAGVFLVGLLPPVQLSQVKCYRPLLSLDSVL